MNGSPVGETEKGIETGARHRGDIAACALYLAGDAAWFVTGQAFVIAGGALC